jgi:hypothetical protein
MIIELLKEELTDAEYFNLTVLLIYMMKVAVQCERERDKYKNWWTINPTTFGQLLIIEKYWEDEDLVSLILITIELSLSIISV